jgi:hypothetical protein
MSEEIQARQSEYYYCPKCHGPVFKNVDTITTQTYDLVDDIWMSEEGEAEVREYIIFHCCNEQCDWSSEGKYYKVDIEHHSETRRKLADFRKDLK